MTNDLDVGWVSWEYLRSYFFVQVLISKINGISTSNFCGLSWSWLLWIPRRHLLTLIRFKDQNIVMITDQLFEVYLLIGHWVKQDWLLVGSRVDHEVFWLLLENQDEGIVKQRSWTQLLVFILTQLLSAFLRVLNVLLRL